MSAESYALAFFQRLRQSYDGWTGRVELVDYEDHGLSDMEAVEIESSVDRWDRGMIPKWPFDCVAPTYTPLPEGSCWRDPVVRDPIADFAETVRISRTQVQSDVWTTPHPCTVQPTYLGHDILNAYGEVETRIIYDEPRAVIERRHIQEIYGINGDVVGMVYYNQ